MANDMTLQTIMQKLSEFEYALVHGGPKHPKYPNLAFANQIDEIFQQYPSLRKDKGYADFLEMYGGALVIYPDESVDAAINGVWDYAEHLLHDPVLENSKFLRFSSIMFRPPVENQLRGVHFAFDMAEEVPTVYRSANYNDYSTKTGMRRTSYERYCDTFLEWLEKFVNANGLLLD